MARAWVFGDDLDTDQMVPGRYAPFMVGQDKFHTYAFCDARPGFAKEVRPGDILVGGENFGCGSSREHVPQAMTESGIRGVVGRSFARIFFRNCVNLGLAIAACPEAVDAARNGSHVAIDSAGAVEVDGERFAAEPAAPFLLELGEAGGLVEWTASKVG